MTPLPLDVTRCRPRQPDAYCRNCRRWLGHPDQTFSPLTWVTVVTGSHDKACAYTPDLPKEGG